MANQASFVNVNAGISQENPAPSATPEVSVVGEVVESVKPPTLLYSCRSIRARVPQELKDLPQWMIWSNTWLKKTGTWAKQPRRIEAGVDDKNKPRKRYTACGYKDTLTTLDVAIARVDQVSFLSGIGFALIGTGVTGVDIDGYVPGCEWAEEIISKFEAIGAYMEVSPSGKGVRIFCRGKLAAALSHKFEGEHTAIESWDDGRYVTVTGVPLARDGAEVGKLWAGVGEPERGGRDLPDGQEVLDWLQAKYRKQPLTEEVTTAHKSNLAAYKPAPGESNDDTDYPWACEVLFNGHFDGLVDDYRTWLEMGFALVSRFGPHAGADLWDRWSQRGANYQTGVCRYKVGTFDKTEKESRTNFGSLVTWAREVGAPLQAKNDPNHPDRWKKGAKAQPATADATSEAESPRVNVGGGGGNGDNGKTDTDNRVMIENSKRNFHETVEKVTEVLAGCPTLYVRHGRLVEVEKEAVGQNAGKLTVADVPAERLARLFSPRAILYTWKKDRKSGDLYQDPEQPVNFMKLVLPQRHYPGVPELAGVQESPYFYGGRFVNNAGYDPESGLLLDGELMVNPPVVGNVTEHQTIEAARFIEDTLGVIGYESNPRQGIWNIAQITMSLQTRWLHRIRPANLITAPEQGSGKTEATNLAVKAATGRDAVSGIALVGNKNFEGELFSHCGGGASYLMFDNIEDGHDFGNAVLDRVITSGIIAGRPLFQNSRIEERPANVVIVGNGNNLSSGSDMNRRCLMTRLAKRPDLGGERYEDRFTNRRKEFARACATVVAWHIQNGCPAPTAAVIQPENFGDWGRYVRDAIWYASKLTGTPIDVMEARREMDKHDNKKGDARDALYAFWLYWNGGEYGTAAKARQPFTAVGIATAMLNLDAAPHVGQIAGIVGRNANAFTVGHKIGKYKDHSLVVGKSKFTLVRDPSDKNARQWIFETEPLDPEEEYPDGYLADLDEYREDESGSTPF